MCWREYEERHDHYEWHGSYDHRKWRRTGTEAMPSSSGGYAWPSAETPQIVVSPPRLLTLPGDPISPPQVLSPIAPMEVDPDWPPLPLPGKCNQLNTSTPWLPLIPMHHALGEHDTVYPMLPKGCHRSRVDNTVCMGAAAKAAQRNEVLGVVPPCSMMWPSNRGFPQTVADWESLLKATRKEGSNRALQLAKAFVTQVQNMPGVQCTEPQCQVLREWTYPVWYTPAPHKGKEHAEPSMIGHLAAALPGWPSGSATDLAATGAAALSLLLFPDLPPPHKDGWQPCHVEEV